MFLVWLLLQAEAKGVGLSGGPWHLFCVDYLSVPASSSSHLLRELLLLSPAGSECKPAARGFTSSTGAVPASGCSSPNARSPTLIAEDEVFFGSMAEERVSERWRSGLVGLIGTMSDCKKGRKSLPAGEKAKPGGTLWLEKQAIRFTTSG